MAAQDLWVMNNGSVCMVHVVSDAAKAWVEENVEVEGWAWMGNAFACEPRYVGALLAGAEADGLVVA